MKENLNSTDIARLADETDERCFHPKFSAPSKPALNRRLQRIIYQTWAKLDRFFTISEKQEIEGVSTSHNKVVCRVDVTSGITANVIPFKKKVAAMLCHSNFE